MSAEEAWYTTAILLERARLQGQLATGASVHIRKRFDQILRPLLYKILEEAEMPTKISEPYKRFLQAIHVQNMVAGGFGKAYHKPPSIPQGDPYSMMVTALILRP